MDIFGGTYTATSLQADALTGAQTTFSSVGPIVALVVGVILAFIFAPKIIGLFKHAGRSTSR